jgi:hypothetical protein
MPPPPVVRDQHHWVAATYAPLTEREARYGIRRGVVRLAAETKIDVFDVLCKSCRRPFEEAVEEPCIVGHWLVGGPIDERAKARHDEGETLTA